MNKIRFVAGGLFIACIVFSPTLAEAQWQTSGSNIYNTNTGKVGIGNTTPSGKLDVSLNASSASSTFPTQTVLHLIGANADNLFMQTDVFGGHGVIDIRRANGTVASPSALLVNDEIGALSFRGYADAASYASGGGRAAITSYAAENWSSTNMGSYLLFSTTANGSTTLTTGMKIGPNGISGNNSDFGVGTFMPNVFGYNPAIQRTLTILGGQNVGSRAVLELAARSDNNVSGNIIGQIDFNAQSQSSTKRIAIIQGLLVGTSTADMGSDLTFLTKTDGGAVAERMRIMGTGNVGIGTSSPKAKLDVAGDIKLNGSLVSDGDICIGKCQ